MTTSFASAGRATGRSQNGSRTMMAMTTQLLPRPVFTGPCTEPSWNHDAAQTFLPRRLNRVSSTATRTGSPSGTSSRTTMRATARPSSSGSQRAPEKNRCARSWLHSRARPAPDSIPHTVRLPGWVRKPQASPQNVRNDGAVNNGAKQASSVIRDAGTGSVSSGIGGIPFLRRSRKHRRCSPLHDRPRSTPASPHVTPRVASAPDAPLTPCRAGDAHSRDVGILRPLPSVVTAASLGRGTALRCRRPVTGTFLGARRNAGRDAGNRRCRW